MSKKGVKIVNRIKLSKKDTVRFGKHSQNTPKPKYKDTLELHFFKGRDGEAVARLDSGKIVIVDRTCKGMIKPDEDWKVGITKDTEKCMIVVPITLTKSAENNRRDVELSIHLLKDHFMGEE